MDSFQKQPSLAWQFYHFRRETALRAQPNAAHRALAKFSLPSVRERIAPQSTFTLITQNVDGLSPRASAALDFSQEQTQEHPLIVEMHGRLFDVSCTSETCEHVEFNTSSPICEALAGTENQLDAGVDPEIPVESLPRCPACGSLSRPGVVLFSETLPQVDLIYDIVEQADMCIVVGTSSVVYPAAGFATTVKDNGGKVAVFNIEKTTPSDLEDTAPDFLFLGPCEDLLPAALGLNDESANAFN
ncbi:DHS-like NAD/FAD-binding domain-containing protein [Crucibulum laeve]|uniref:DHS-like NAD/FAD-binding domain-containing protein n=1 Tax=Crucibulum laeve TaxID=68775 RepID=A0A5C3MCV3_9AGAR|nr:DHS-like NAD/FAD-binding domain-containing protein [Crucibulum laeve]